MDQPQLERRPRNRTVVSSDQVEKAQEELLCSICIDFFKQPRSLPCQHSFCHDCLVPLASRPTSGSKTSASKGVVISCPECRANTCLPENGVRDLPKNFKLEKIVEILTPSERAEIQYTRVRRPAECLLHQQKPIEYYCNSCSTVACGDCLVEKHLNHDVHLARDVLPQHVNDLQALIPCVQKTLQEGTATLAVLESHSNSLRREGEQSIRDIEEYFDKLRTILSEREAKLKDEVNIQVKQRLVTTNKKVVALRKSLQEGGRLFERLHHLTTSQKESVDVLIEEKQLTSSLRSSQNDLEERGNESNRVVPSVYPPLLYNPGIESLLKSIGTKTPVPVPRRLKLLVTQSNTLESSSKEHYTQVPPNSNCAHESNSSDEEDISAQLTPSDPPTPPSRFQSYGIAPDIKVPAAIHEARSLCKGFRNASEPIFPCGVCCGVSNTLIVTDVRNHCFRILTSTGKCLDVVGKEGKGDGMFGEPTAVATDKDGDILICDLSPARLQRFSPQGQFISKLGERVFRGKPLGEPWGVAVNFDGKIFVSDWEKSCIHIYNSSGHYSGSFKPSNIQPPLEHPAGIAVDKRGRVIVADRGNHSIWIYTPEGIVLSRFGTKGHAPGDLYFPFGVAVDKHGMIYISESGNHRISVFGANGEFSHCFGMKGSKPGMFQLPRHMCIDNNGRLVVSDEQNQRVQVFDI